MNGDLQERRGELAAGAAAAGGFLLLLFILQMAVWLAMVLALGLYAAVWLLTRRRSGAAPSDLALSEALVRRIAERGRRVPNPAVQSRVLELCEQGAGFVRFLSDHPSLGHAWGGVARECLEGTLRIVDQYLELARYFEHPATDTAPAIDALLDQVAMTLSGLRSRLLAEKSADLSTETESLRATLQAIDEVTLERRGGGGR